MRLTETQQPAEGCERVMVNHLCVSDTGTRRRDQAHRHRCLIAWSWSSSKHEQILLFEAPKQVFDLIIELLLFIIFKC